MSRPGTAEGLGPGHLVVGTYTGRLPHVDGRAEGILGCSLVGDTVSPPRALARAGNPSFVVLSGDGRRLYAVNESPGFEGRPGGGVSAFRRDPSMGELSEGDSGQPVPRQPRRLRLRRRMWTAHDAHPDGRAHARLSPARLLEAAPGVRTAGPRMPHASGLGTGREGPGRTPAHLYLDISPVPGPGGAGRGPSR